MTSYEAIARLRDHFRVHDDGRATPYLNRAAAMAINALEKQMPKKVRYEDVGYEQYDNVNVYACICPSCDLEIIKFDDNDVSKKCESDDVEKMFHSSMVHHAYVGLNNYCNRCGQKLDWSEESEE